MTTLIPDTTSVFNDAAEIFDVYAVELQFRDRILGGIPGDPEIIEAWLRTKAGITDQEELRVVTQRTLEELGEPIMSYDAQANAVQQVAAVKHLNRFKTDEDGLYIEDRQIKAALKEATNILFAGERWGTTRKGPRSFVSERVFIRPARIHLGRTQPDTVETVIGHVTGPRGPRSTLTYHESCVQPVIAFELLAQRDQINDDQWRDIWILAQENGLGALRSQSHGRFDVTRWEVIS